MNGIENRAAFAKILIDRVREDRYPSGAQMDIIEQVVPAPLVPEYLDVLLEKVEEDRFPSIPMLRRIQRVVSSMA
jgi:hypothetical protein